MKLKNSIPASSDAAAKAATPEPPDKAPDKAPAGTPGPSSGMPAASASARSSQLQQQQQSQPAQPAFTPDVLQQLSQLAQQQQQQQQLLEQLSAQQLPPHSPSPVGRIPFGPMNDISSKLMFLSELSSPLVQQQPSKLQLFLGKRPAGDRSDGSGSSSLTVSQYQDQAVFNDNASMTSSHKRLRTASAVAAPPAAPPAPPAASDAAAPAAAPAADPADFDSAQSAATIATLHAQLADVCARSNAYEMQNNQLQATVSSLTKQVEQLSTLVRLLLERLAAAPAFPAVPAVPAAPAVPPVLPPSRTPRKNAAPPASNFAQQDATLAANSAPERADGEWVAVVRRNITNSPRKDLLSSVSSPKLKAGYAAILDAGQASRFKPRFSPDAERDMGIRVLFVKDDKLRDKNYREVRSLLAGINVHRRQLLDIRRIGRSILMLVCEAASAARVRSCVAPVFALMPDFDPRTDVEFGRDAAFATATFVDKTIKSIKRNESSIRVRNFYRRVLLESGDAIKAAISAEDQAVMTMEVEPVPAPKEAAQPAAAAPAAPAPAAPAVSDDDAHSLDEMYNTPCADMTVDPQSC
ncbi:hypothetical protein BC831DRAFT_495948 [Entophlyctis helioformis]|nr:hypothetical protein BC831DRAFT_495948 [Entophlyctis helioformis]